MKPISYRERDGRIYYSAIHKIDEGQTWYWVTFAGDQVRLQKLMHQNHIVMIRTSYVLQTHPLGRNWYQVCSVGVGSTFGQLSLS